MTDVKRLLDEKRQSEFDNLLRAWGHGEEFTESLASWGFAVIDADRMPDYEAAVDALEALLSYVETWGDAAVAAEMQVVDEARAVLRRLREKVPA